MTLAAPPQPAARVQQTATLRASATRRGRVIRRVILMVAATIGAIGVTLWNRDRLALAAEERRFEFWKQEFEELHASGKSAPLDVPAPPKSNRRIWDTYGYNVMYPTDALSHGRTAVIFRRSALNLYLRSSGRHALIYDGKTFAVEWFSGAQPSDAAQAVGIHRGP